MAKNHGDGNPRLATTNPPGEAEFLAQQAHKTSKTFKKRREGTEGIDATDERDESDRLEEGFSMMNGDD